MDALSGEQAFDPVHVLHAFDDQPLALTGGGAACILALHCAHLPHVAGCPVAAAPRHQSAQQHRRVQPISLGVPCPPGDLQAVWIHHPTNDLLGRERTVQPEPIIADLVAENDLRCPSGYLLRLKWPKSSLGIKGIPASLPVARRDCSAPLRWHKHGHALHGDMFTVEMHRVIVAA